MTKGVIGNLAHSRVLSAEFCTLRGDSPCSLTRRIRSGTAFRCIRRDRAPVRCPDSCPSV